MNKYNLAEFLTTKTEAQILRLIEKKIKIASENWETIFELGYLDFEDHTPKKQKVIKNAERKLDDALAWIADCSLYFSKSKWGDMVLLAGGTLEEFGKEVMEDRY